MEVNTYDAPTRHIQLPDSTQSTAVTQQQHSEWDGLLLQCIFQQELNSTIMSPDFMIGLVTSQNLLAMVIVPDQ